MEIVALSWNLFHGRDFPPDPALRSTRSRLLRRAERNETHLQVNRELFDEFADVLSGARWDVALLQECPPRWTRKLAAACEAEVHRSLTSRNWLPPIQWALARANPDLIASWEGGSNAILLRNELRADPTAARRLVLRRSPERRTMAFVQSAAGVSSATLHASTVRALATEEVRTAAEEAVAWSGDGPLIFGGDFNLRPRETDVFDELAERFDLRGVTAPTAIDHILSRGVDVLEPARPWAPADRELTAEGLAIRLSDHTPVEARFRLPLA